MLILLFSDDKFSMHTTLEYDSDGKMDDEEDTNSGITTPKSRKLLNPKS